MNQCALLGIAVGFGCGLGVGYLLFRRKRLAVSLVNPSESQVAEFADLGECKLVLVVRNDLKMGKGKVAAQCCHATVMSYKQLSKQYPDLLAEWRQGGQAKVVLKTEDEDSLLRLASNARNVGLVVSIVQDAGRTQVAPGSKTVVGIGPGPKALVDKITGHLKLY